ncbi:cytochrome C [Oryzomonas japonica]|uniref:Cytochrome C n=1 Tax=Oryzomonas japonica TaxID=2603858 RepID=A0A7J4ZNS3_9BACT|nr:cytochrome c3 family protein [Oryzomonas japonica]KAB0664482.1 cytochrome C [Oryzomonas japonica]
MGKLLCHIVVAMCCAGMLTGCDPLARHKVVSTIFDGVPSMPEPQQFCQEYHEVKLAEEREAAAAQQRKNSATSDSRHEPYDQKRCNDCHDKTKEGGLIRPPNELCFMCHPDLTKGAFTHGPAAVGDCLACHVPHSSAYGPLLKVKAEDVCVTCHREKRQAKSMHDNVAAKGMICINCHNPHSGNAPYFLK